MHDALGELGVFEIGWGSKISEMRMTPCPSTERAPLKKGLPHPPLWSPFAIARQVWPDAPETDTRTMYQAVGGAADPNS